MVLDAGESAALAAQVLIPATLLLLLLLLLLLTAPLVSFRSFRSFRFLVLLG